MRDSLRGQQHNVLYQRPSITGLRPATPARAEGELLSHAPVHARKRSLVALLTGGGDKPYALGLASALTAQDICLDFIGSEKVDSPELHGTPLVNFLNLRGNQKSDVGFARKALRVLAYYWRLVFYAAKAKPSIFHILWNEKLEHFDRTALMLYYKLLGKRIAFTAHNVNAGKRDANDSLLNRLTLKVQYRLADHIFVHTEKMKCELLNEFRAPESKVSVIPFGINNTVPNTRITTAEARRSLGLHQTDKTILFFGHIAPYKGLEYAIEALAEVAKKCDGYRLIIAGKLNDCENYWRQIQQTIADTNTRSRIIERIEYIPDEQTEIYFKAADVLILPYTHVFQSGVLFLGYSFGLPVIAADVGSLREDIIEGKTGYIFRPKDAIDLAKTIERYFSSPLFKDLELRRQEIRDHANERYSWSKAGAITRKVYQSLSRPSHGHF
jgi:glycosyltransferase involved in cell wall biosynthesis